MVPSMVAEVKMVEASWLGGRLLHLLGEAEIQNLHLTPLAEHDVGRLDVAVGDSLAVRLAQSLRHLFDNAQRLRHRHRAAAQHMKQVLAAHQLHHDEGMPFRGFSVVVDTGDMRMVESRCRARLAQESRAKLRILRRGRGEFDGHPPGPDECLRRRRPLPCRRGPVCSECGNGKSSARSCPGTPIFRQTAPGTQVAQRQAEPPAHLRRQDLSWWRGRFRLRGERCRLWHNDRMWNAIRMGALVCGWWLPAACARRTIN